MNRNFFGSAYLRAKKSADGNPIRRFLSWPVAMCPETGGQLLLALFTVGALFATLSVENEAEQEPEDEFVVEVAFGFAVEFGGQMAHLGSPV